MHQFWNQIFQKADAQQEINSKPNPEAGQSRMYQNQNESFLIQKSKTIEVFEICINNSNVP